MEARRGIGTCQVTDPHQQRTDYNGGTASEGMPSVVSAPTTIKQSVCRTRKIPGSRASTGYRRPKPRGQWTSVLRLGSAACPPSTAAALPTQIPNGYDAAPGATERGSANRTLAQQGDPDNEKAGTHRNHEPDQHRANPHLRAAEPHNSARHRRQNADHRSKEQQDAEHIGKTAQALSVDQENHHPDARPRDRDELPSKRQPANTGDSNNRSRRTHRVVGDEPPTQGGVYIDPRRIGDTLAGEPIICTAREPDDLADGFAMSTRPSTQISGCS